jgi:hypothetical protein
MSSLSFTTLAPRGGPRTQSCDRVLQFESTKKLPNEILALGEAERVYAPSPFAARLGSWRHVFAFGLVAGIAGLYALIFLDLQRKGQLNQLADPMILAVFGGLGAVFVGVAIWMTGLKPTTATVYFYHEAAVVAEGDQLTLIPWQLLLWLPGQILTAQGHKFYCGRMQNHDRFEEAIWERSAEFWVPEALKKVHAGETVTCGDLSVSASGIGWKDKTATWEEVTRLVIVHGRVYRLNIGTRGALWDFATIDLYQVPNARAIERLIAEVAPPRLLKPAA